MDPARPYPPIDLLAELLQGYRHPAVATADDAVVCMNAAALGQVDKLGDSATIAKDWPPLATFQTSDGQTFLLRCPARTHDAGPPARALPPRLARVAGLVVDGLTDKRIAQRLGLTFSTVRTYVRQIYRRVGVHSRVGLVHAVRAGTARTDDAPSPKRPASPLRQGGEATRGTPSVHAGETKVDDEAIAQAGELLRGG
jgi:DNA-binding CsgD family transcriptional regulator